MTKATGSAGSKVSLTRKKRQSAGKDKDKDKDKRARTRPSRTCRSARLCWTSSSAMMVKKMVRRTRRRVKKKVRKMASERHHIGCIG